MKETSNKSRLVALILCWLVGLLGIHRFYVGKVGTGVAILLLSLTGVGMLVTGIWVLIDLILIATGKFEDKAGALLTEWANK